MTGLNFEGGQTERLYSPELNNMALNNSIGVIEGCEITTNGSVLEMSAGQVFFGSNVVEVSAVSNINFSAYGGVDKRTDIVIIDKSGNPSYIEGTSSELGVPPNYDNEDYYCLAIIAWSTVSLEITDALKDIRVINIINYPFTTKFEEEVVSFTTGIITHDLKDKFVDVTAYGTDGIKIDIQEVKVVDVDNVELTFASSFTGTILIIGGSSQTETGTVLPDVGSSNSKKYLRINDSDEYEYYPAATKGSGSISAGLNTDTVINSEVLEDSLVQVIIDDMGETVPVGIWEVNASNGSFTVTSTEVESVEITYKYYIIN